MGISNILTNVNSSRLITSTEALRNTLLTRNLYTPNNMYPLESTDTGKIIKTIDSIIGIIAPFKSFDLENTVIGRLAGDKTPISVIGLAMLGKQFAYNEMSHVAQQTYGVFKPSNLFDGNRDTKLFVRNSDMTITSQSAKTTFGQFIQNITTSNFNNRDSVFNSKSENSNYIENTGSGQLNFLYTALNKNLYVENDPTLIKYGDKINNPLKPRSTYLEIKTNAGDINSVYVGGKKYFNFNFNPYNSIIISDQSQENANSSMLTSYDNAARYDLTQEYAPNNVYVDDVFGKTLIKGSDKEISSINDQYEINSWINPNTGFKSDDTNTQIVWGRDGITSATKANLRDLQGLSDEQRGEISEKALSKDFNVNSGLLKYTSELLNASDGNLIDITRKAFAKGSKLVGFNGSGLWKSPSWALKTGTGTRQHSSLDQYDRYAKAIRFEGNQVYDGNVGNVDSVIHKTVMPKIHPIYKDNIYSSEGNKNLMFSIENLAIRVISKDSVGIIDDGEGSTIPVSEVGQFNGRIMWFPPYNIEILETTNAKYESTSMIGRSEPIYNYLNSERSATLNFTLLIDYPPQLRNKVFNGTSKHKEIAEFFAFGYSGEESKTPKTSNPQRIDALKTQIAATNETKMPEITVMNNVVIPPISFPNDMPNESQINTIFDYMYDMGYEVSSDCLPTDETSWGINGKSVYSNDELIPNDAWIEPSSFINKVDTSVNSQYDYIGDGNELNKELINFFTNEVNRKYYEIKIIGSASLLYDNPTERNQYNEALGKRRAEATKVLIDYRLSQMFGKNHGVKITFDGDGSKGSTTAPTSTALAANISTKETKLSRTVQVRIVRSSITPDAIEPSQPISTLQKETLDTLQKQMGDETSNYYKNKRGGINDNTLDERKSNSKMPIGFQDVSENVYVPAFHSQTPEEFHRRLVFLQQCMKQGAAQRKGDSIKNSVFGRQPICILRIADFMYTKVIIENLTVDYTETTWDMNPEGFGMQPMLAKVTLQMKIIGGQSLKGPIDALQNAVSFNYYANSTFSNNGMYAKPYNESTKQNSYITGILATETKTLNDAENNRRNAELAANKNK